MLHRNYIIILFTIVTIALIIPKSKTFRTSYAARAHTLFHYRSRNVLARCRWYLSGRIDQYKYKTDTVVGRPMQIRILQQQNLICHSKYSEKPGPLRQCENKETRVHGIIVSQLIKTIEKLKTRSSPTLIGHMSPVVLYVFHTRKHRPVSCNDTVRSSNTCIPCFVQSLESHVTWCV